MAKAIPLPVVQTGFEQSVQAGKKAVGTIRLPVDIDPSAFNKLSQPLGRITGLATEFEKSIAASNARVLAFGASVGILNAVSKGFKSILDNGIAVEKALGDIGAISGQSAAQIDKLGDSLFNVAKNTSQSFGVAAKAALEFSRQGLSVEETVKRTNDALTLTRFTSLSAADAVDTLTAAVNSFAGSGITTTEILNKLIAVDTAFAVSAEDLANGLSRAGSIAQEVGVSFDELNGLIAVTQEKTARGGAVIGNALKTIFTRIRSDETVKALRSVGVESVDAAGNLRDVVPILTDLSNKLKDLGGGERIQILEAVASKYNINILSALLGDIGNAQGQFVKAVRTSLGAGNEAFERQAELNKLLDSLLNKAAESAAQLGNNLAKIGVNDNLKSLVGYVNSFLDSINKLLTSDDTGGDLARGIIKGFSDVLFKVGLPLIAAIFVKLTKDIATFGIESLQTILGINQKVKERQALEQAVTNTLISNKGIMDQILATGGNQVKQQEILLKAYGDQIAALKTIQSISASVAPALQGAGLVVTPNGVGKKDEVKGKAAEGYLPAREAADVRRGVGGASSSSKVVSIPNFAFGGGARGTMIANTSEYVVPNFANGGSAIFNQDMVKAYGLPAGAKKIGAAGGYIPNFAKYIYDSDRIPADKNATLKAILASPAKKNLIIGPAGAGKSTLAAGMGTFLTGAADVANATEIDILSGAGRTKDGGLSKNLESIMAAVNSSGGKVSYLYTKNLDILSRRAGRTDPSEGDLRSKKQIAGTAYAPLNQFDFMGMVKSRANSFSMVRGAKGFIPNFADINEPERFAALIGKKSGSDNGLLNRYSLWASQDSQGKVQVSDIAKPTSGDEQNGKLIKFNAYGVPSKSDKQLTDVKQQLSEYGKNSAVQLAQNMTSQALPSDFVQGKLAATFNPGSLSSFAGTIFEASVGALLGDKSFKDYSEQAVTSAFDLDIRSNQNIKKDFKIPNDVDFLEVKGSDSPPLIKSIAKKIYQVTELNRAAVSKRKIGNTELKQLGMQRPLSDLDKLIVIENGKTTQFGSQKELEDYVSSKYTKNVGNSTIAGSPKFGENVWPSIGPRTKRGAGGYIPNFAQGGPLEDAIQREMDAGLDPSQIRVTTDGKLKSPSNPNGFAVINTRDEPNGKIPNFARIGTPKAGYETSDPSFIASGSPVLPKDIQSNLIKAVNAQIRAFEAGAIDQSQLNNEIKNLAAQSQLTQKSEQKLQSQVDLAVSKLNSTQTNQSAAPKQGREFDMGKLILGFSALTFATGTLEGSLKKLDNGFADVIVASSKIASSLGTGAALGSTLKEFGKGKSWESFANTLPYVGAAILGVVAAMDMYEESLQKAIEKTKQRKEESYKNATQSSEDPEERASKKKAEIETLRARENKIQAELNNPKNYTKDKEGNVDFKDKEKLGKELLDIQEKINIESQTENQLFIEAINARKERNKQEFLAYDQAQKRLVLAKILNQVNSEFTKNQNKGNLQQSKDLAKTLVDSNKLTKSERDIELINENQKKFEKQKSDLKAETLKKAIGALASESAVATVNKEQLDILLKDLQAGKKIEDVTRSLNLLGSSNAKIAAEKLETIISEGDQAYETLDTQQQQARVGEEANLTLKQRLDIEDAITQRIKEQIDFANEYRDLVLKTENEKADFEERKPITLLERDISQQQGGATKQQEYDLSVLKNKARIASEQRRLEFDRVKETNAIEDEAKKSLSASLDKVGYISDPDKIDYKKRIAEAQSAQEAAQIVSELLAPSAIASENEDVQAKNLEQQGNLMLALININNKKNKRQQETNDSHERENQLLDTSITLQEKLNKLKLESPLRYGAQKAMVEINNEANVFAETFSYNTTIGFRDGLRDALGAAVSGTDDLRGALEGVAQGFLKTMQQAFLQQASNNVMQGLTSAFPSLFQMPKTASKGGYIQKFAAGGMVTGGSGIRDDVPAMLSSGEYVMRKSAVQKYGAENMAKMNDGGIFLPGVRGGSAISGYDQLSKFANQTTTSGATDILKGQRSAAFANLEDQSVRLSRFGLMNEDTIKGEIASAQQQGLELIAQREAYRTQQRKAMQQQLVGTALSLAINVGTSKLSQKTPFADTAKGMLKAGAPSALAARSGLAYGGMIAGFNNGGGPTDDIPALLMGGEYVMDRATVRKYGKQYLDSMNSGRAKFAEGGYAGAEAETTTESTDSKAKVDAATGTAVNISINVSGGNSSTESQGQTSQGGVDYKKMSERIKAVVLETLNEEKRLGGSLRTR